MRALASMVEGPSPSTLRFRRRKIVNASAPPTALRAVPPPRFAGRDEKRDRATTSSTPLFDAIDRSGHSCRLVERI